MCLYSYVLQRKDIQAVLHTNPSPLLILKRFCVLGHIMQREAARGRKEKKAHLNIFTIFHSLPCFTSYGGVSNSGTPHLKHSSARDSVSSNKRHRETTRLFSVITQKSLPILWKLQIWMRMQLETRKQVSN